MENWIIALLICGMYLVVTLVTGVLSGRTASSSVTGYVAGDRSMNTVFLYFVLGASVFSAFAFLGGPGWAYSRGTAALYIIAYGIAGMVPLYFIGPRVRKLGEKFGFVTQAELLAHRFESRPLSILLAILSIIAFHPLPDPANEGGRLYPRSHFRGTDPAVGWRPGNVCDRLDLCIH